MPPRKLRIIWECDADKPWIVQYDTPTSYQWTDVLRFASYMQAAGYVDDIKTRDQVLLKAVR